MAYTADQINQLETAIAQGALTVKYADKEVTYRSLNDMLQLLRVMKGNSDVTAPPSSGRKYAQFSTGLNSCE